jgi:hypothetical protein
MLPTGVLDPFAVYRGEGRGLLRRVTDKRRDRSDDLRPRFKAKERDVH